MHYNNLVFTLIVCMNIRIGRKYKERLILNVMIEGFLFKLKI